MKSLIDILQKSNEKFKNTIEKLNDEKNIFKKNIDEL